MMPSVWPAAGSRTSGKPLGKSLASKLCWRLDPPSVLL